VCLDDLVRGPSEWALRSASWEDMDSKEPSDIRCGWVVQKWEDGVRVRQIQGGRGRQMCTSWQRGGRHELKQAGVGRGRISVAVSSS
jgi:hypothetical protein